MFELMYHPPPISRQSTVPAKSRARHAAALAAAFVVAAVSSVSAAPAALSSSFDRSAQLSTNILPASSSALPSSLAPKQPDTAFARDGGGADRVFQSDFVSARDVAAFARNGVPSGVVEPVGLRDTPPGAAAPDLRGKALSETISALQTSGSAARLASAAGGEASLAFWEDSQSTPDEAISSEISIESAALAAAAGVGPANVLIPLPAAAWSGLSVMGGVGIMSGIRRFLRRSK